MKNWKTSLVGLLLAIWLVIQPIIANGTFDVQKDWKMLVYASIAVVFSYYTKDKDVTGGTKQQ